MIYIQLINNVGLKIDEEEVIGGVGETIIRANWLLQPGDTIKIIDDEEDN